MTILGGCATTGQAPVSRQLPPESSVVLDPVPEPKLSKGQDARVALAKTGSALKEANGRLVKSRIIYRGVRKAYGSQ
jgi:hypothetical protein